MPKNKSRNRKNGERIYNRGNRPRGRRHKLIKEAIPASVVRNPCEDHVGIETKHSQHQPSHISHQKTLDCSSLPDDNSQRDSHLNSESDTSENKYASLNSGLSPSNNRVVGRIKPYERDINNNSEPTRHELINGSNKPDDITHHVSSIDIDPNSQHVCNTSNSSNWISSSGASILKEARDQSSSKNKANTHIQHLLLERSEPPTFEADEHFEPSNAIHTEETVDKLNTNSNAHSIGDSWIHFQSNEFYRGQQTQLRVVTDCCNPRDSPEYLNRTSDPWPRGSQLECILDQVTLYRAFTSSSPPTSTHSRLFVSNASEDKDDSVSETGSALESLVSGSSSEQVHDLNELEDSESRNNNITPTYKNLRSPISSNCEICNHSILDLRQEVFNSSNCTHQVQPYGSESADSPETWKSSSNSCYKLNQHNYDPTLDYHQKYPGRDSVLSDHSPESIDYPEIDAVSHAIDSLGRYGLEHQNYCCVEDYADDNIINLDYARSLIHWPHIESKFENRYDDWDKNNELPLDHRSYTDCQHCSRSAYFSRTPNEYVSYSSEHTHKISSSSLLSDECENSDLDQHFKLNHRGYRLKRTRSAIQSSNYDDSTQNDNSFGGSMKSIRDIVKLSIPSFSSLQYLPGQMETSNRGKQMNDPSKTSDNISHQGREKNTNNNNNNNNNNESTKHDELHLFQKLCLCNCGSKINRKNNETRNDSDNKLMTKSLDCADLSTSVKSRNSGNMEANRYRDRDIDRDRAQSAISTEQTGDKALRDRRSANFFTRLKPSSSSLSDSRAASKMSDAVPNESSQEANTKGLKTGALVSDDITASSDLWPTNDKSSRIVKKTKEDNRRSPSPFSLSSCLRHLRGLSHSSNEDISASDLDTHRPASSSAVHSAEAHTLSHIEQDKRPQSACSLREVSKAKNDETSSGKFDAAPKSNDEASTLLRLSDEHSENEKSINATPQHRHRSTSFLARSLNRFSRRKQTGSTQEVTKSSDNDPGYPTQKDGASCDELSDLQASQSGLSSISLQRSWSESFNSFGQSSSCSRTLSPTPDPVEPVVKLFLAPEIILNQVEFTDTRNGHLRPTTNSARIPTESLSSEYNTNCESTSSDFISSSGSGERSPRLSNSPIQFKSPMAPVGSRIEDGAEIVSTEHFEKHIENIKNNQLDAQKRLFKTWINYYCPNLIHGDLIDELRDGVKLVGLLAYLARDKKLMSQYERLISDKQSFIFRLATSHASIHRHLSNVSIVVNYLREKRQMKLVNLNLMDIVSGKPNVILGLCWGIILNFQLDLSTFERRDLGASGLSSNLTSRCQSRISLSSTTSDDPSPKRSTSRYRNTKNYVEEYSPQDLVVARKNLLDKINKKFNLKLTNLTSSLLDSDVLLSIISRLLTNDEERLALNNYLDENCWHKMNEDSKLDLCFEVAESKLRVPRLFSAADLKQQTLADDRSKPILVYLSMLINENYVPQKSAIYNEPGIDSERVLKQAHDFTDNLAVSLNKEIVSRLNKVDTKDKFELNKINYTLAQIQELTNIFECADKSELINCNLKKRFENLKAESAEVENLILWINNADRLFETPQKSTSDISSSLKQYQNFFAFENSPKIPIGICKTLERQYQECLCTAKQRIISMERTLKNWKTFEESQNALKNWLSVAEMKLSEALCPIVDVDGEDHLGVLSQHTNRLDSIIEYFQYEEIDSEPILDCNTESNSNYAKSSRLSLNDSNGNTGSALSLLSVGSRTSLVRSSKRASYHRLIDDFDRKCKLLADMLDLSQKNALLVASKELKSRLKFITELRVPQVVNELRSSIRQCELWISGQGDHDNSSQLNSLLATSVNPLDKSKTPESSDENEGNQMLPGPTTTLETNQIDSSFGQDQYLTPIESPVSLPDTNTPTNLVKARKKRETPPKSTKRKSSKSKGQEKKQAKHKLSGDEPNDNYSVGRKIRHACKSFVNACWKTMPFNIVLLLFVAGMFVVPMLQKDACCELSPSYIPPAQINFREKPT